MLRFGYLKYLSSFLQGCIAFQSLYGSRFHIYYKNRMVWYFSDHSRFKELNRKKIIHGAACLKAHTGTV